MQLIKELNKEEKGILLKLIETFVYKKRFKDYLLKIIAAVEAESPFIRALLLSITETFFY